MFRGLIRPGQGFKPFKIYRQESGVTAKGRPYTKDCAPVGVVVGMISRSDPAEKDQSKQKGHPISYTILQQGVKDRAQAMDYLVLEEGDTKRYFLVQKDPHNPGGLDHFLSYQVEERADMKWE